MRGPLDVAVVAAFGAFAWLVEIVTGLAWLGAVTIVAMFTSVWVQMRRLVKAQRSTDERVSDLERAIGTGGGD